MKQLLASLSILPLMWFSVAPRGAEICGSGEAFNYHPQSESGRQAGKEAKAAFCKTVASLPR